VIVAFSHWNMLIYLPIKISAGTPILEVYQDWSIFIVAIHVFVLNPDSAHERTILDSNT